jgi:uncharacterized protein (TIGR02118 family)
VYRLMSFLKRRADLDRAGFVDWWLNHHAPLIVEVPGLRRYVVSPAAVPSSAVPDETSFDGVAELWFDDADALARGFGSAAGAAARADGAAHTSRVERLHVEEHPFVDTGSAPRFKLVAALKRRADLDRAAFKAWWLGAHAPLVVQFPELARYQVNLVPPGEEEGFADGVAEVCFNDLETLARVIFSPQVKAVQEDSVAHSSAINRLLAREHPIVL